MHQIPSSKVSLKHSSPPRKDFFQIISTFSAQQRFLLLVRPPGSMTDAVHKQWRLHPLHDMNSHWKNDDPQRARSGMVGPKIAPDIRDVRLSLSLSDKFTSFHVDGRCGGEIELRHDHLNTQHPQDGLVQRDPEQSANTFDWHVLNLEYIYIHKMQRRIFRRLSI